MWMRYARTNITEMRRYIVGEDMTGISVSPFDKASGSPKEGDMIARDILHHKDQWLVSEGYFNKNFTVIHEDN